MEEAKRSRDGRGARLMGVALAITVAGCGRTPTELLVFVVSDLRVPADLATIDVDARDADGRPLSGSPHRFSLERDGALPLSFGVVPRGNDDARVTITVTGTSPSGRTRVSAARILDGFIAHATLGLTIPLLRACTSTTCAPDQPCLLPDSPCALDVVRPEALCDRGAACAPDPLPASCSTRAPRALAGGSVGGAAVAGEDGRIYVFAGDWAPLGTRATSVFDPELSTWTPSTPRTLPGSGFAAVRARDGTIYLFGVGASADSVLRFDPAAATWTLLEDAPLPHPRRHLCAALAGDGLVYLVGGTAPASDRPIEAVDVFSPEREAFVDRTPDMRIPVEGCAAAGAPNGEVWVLGGLGRGSSGESVIGAVQVYDPEAQEWRSEPPLNQARAFVAAATDGARLYAAGGCLPDQSDLPDVEALELKQGGGREPLPSLHQRRCEASAAFGGDGRLYVVGGTHVDGGSSTTTRLIDRVEAYCPASKEWW